MRDTSKHHRVLGLASKSMRIWSDESQQRRSHGNLRYSMERMDLSVNGEAMYQFVNGEAMNVMQVGSGTSKAC